MRRHLGFTLVELLVVIAIISVLAALLLPTLGQSIYSARLMSCGNNMRQVGYGVNAYANDFRDCYPYRSTQAVMANCSPFQIVSGSDDRTKLRPYFPISLLACPLTPYPTSTMLDTYVASLELKTSYEMWFGWRFSNGTTMKRPGDRPRSFTILLSDLDGLYAPWIIASHPDRNGLLGSSYQYGAWAGANWGGNSTVGRGLLDRNFLSQDCSLKTLNDLRQGTTDPRMVDSGCGGVWRAYLPAK